MDADASSVLVVDNVQKRWELLVKSACTDSVSEGLACDICSDQYTCA